MERFTGPCADHVFFSLFGLGIDPKPYRFRAFQKIQLYSYALS